MRALLDTNVVIRHLTGEPPAQARRATAFLAARHELILTDLVVAEIVYVLESVYRRARAEIATIVRSLLGLRSVVVTDAEVLLRTIELYEDARLDFADAYLVAIAGLGGLDRVALLGRVPTAATGYFSRGRHPSGRAEGTS